MKDLFRDKDFFNTMIKLAAPIMLQNLIFSSLGLIDGVLHVLECPLSEAVKARKL